MTSYVYEMATQNKNTCNIHIHRKVNSINHETHYKDIRIYITNEMYTNNKIRTFIFTMGF